MPSLYKWFSVQLLTQVIVYNYLVHACQTGIIQVMPGLCYNPLNQANIYPLCLSWHGICFQLAVNASKGISDIPRGKIRMYEGKNVHAKHKFKYCGLDTYWQLCLPAIDCVLIHKNLHCKIFFKRSCFDLEPSHQMPQNTLLSPATYQKKLVPWKNLHRLQNVHFWSLIENVGGYTFRVLMLAENVQCWHSACSAHTDQVCLQQHQHPLTRLSHTAVLSLQPESELCLLCVSVSECLTPPRLTPGHTPHTAHPGWPAASPWLVSRWQGRGAFLT